MNLGRKINETGLDSEKTPSEDKTAVLPDEKKNIYSECDSTSHLTFASSDAHDGPRTDISFVLLNMNQSFLHIGPRNASKNYPQGMP